MSITCGFFNSINHDRKYDTRDISSIFDGLIIDGIFATIGNSFIVKAYQANTVHIDTGKAWFNHTWTVNDAIYPIELPVSEVLLDRIDAVVLEINNSDSVRENRFVIVKGVPSSAPIKPTLTHSETINQYALCYIFRKAGSGEIHQADITNAVGTSETPFVVAMLKTISLDELLGQWQDDLNIFMNGEKKRVGDFIDDQSRRYSLWIEDMKKSLEQEQQLLDQWISSEQTDFLAWFNQMKGQLDADPAGHLALRIDSEEIRRILTSGFVDGTKTFSENGDVITSISSSNKKLIKTFTDDFRTITTVLNSASGGNIAKMVKRFSPDGKTVTTNVIYY